MNADYFQKTQPHLAKLFTNSRLSGRLSHAYLLYGDPAAPLRETALFLAQSLFCSEEITACGHCPNCLRFTDGNHPDFTLVDGSTKTIKKDDIGRLAEKYALGTVEKSHVACYIISEIGNITDEAANSLLKFLEEPSSALIAILTTSNIERCLPTIISRCVTVHVMTPPPIIGKQSNGLYSREEEYALSLFAADPGKMAELSKNDDFINAFQITEMFVKDLISSVDKAAYFLYKEGLELLKSQSALKFFISLNIKVFSATLAKNFDGPFGQWSLGLKSFSDVLPASIAVLEDMLMTLPANMNLVLNISRLLDILYHKNSI